jgi:UDP-N-acetylglucosamine/UDP-N-acetylgalactosamine diphosphorylase
MKFSILCFSKTLEYSEINEVNRNARDANGDLVFNASHSVICNYDLDFVINFCNNHLDTLSYVSMNLFEFFFFSFFRYHLARKAIPYIDENGNKVRPTSVNGTKFELFSFDIFESAKRLSAFEINRYAMIRRRCIWSHSEGLKNFLH